MARRESKEQVKEKPIDIFQNFLVPKHEIISEKEKRELLKKHDIATKQLPKIMKKDPAAVALGAKPGDIIKICRKNPVAGDVFYYRLVKSS